MSLGSFGIFENVKVSVPALPTVRRYFADLKSQFHRPAIATAKINAAIAKTARNTIHLGDNRLAAGRHL